ncbi:hypothetical protein LPJ59_000969 [Coemansia sp. RSA 2399]|nr:hypothetical protein LPJ59_000969 [Coemansia sp. RSA 2399]
MAVRGNAEAECAEGHSPQTLAPPNTSSTPTSRKRSDSCQSQQHATSHSTAKFAVPAEEECWPVTMLLEMYPELRFERWLPSRLRTITKTSSNVYDERLLRGPNKRVLCLWCSKETKEGGSLFCPHPSRQPSGAKASSSSDTADSTLGEGCEHEHRVRRDGQYVRRQLFLRDQGMCAKCGVDTHDLFTLATACCSLPQRNNMLKQLVKQNPEWDKKMRKPLTSMEYEFTQGMFWEAAHKVDIKHGGGLCSLDGLQTLCVPCHAAEYMRNYAEEVRNLQTFQSPPAPSRSKEAAASSQAANKSKDGSALVLSDKNANASSVRPTADIRIASKHAANPAGLKEKQPNTPHSTLPDNDATAATNRTDHGTASHLPDTPTKQLLSSSAKKPGSVSYTQKTLTNAKSASRTLKQRIDLIVDLTSPHGKPVLSFPDDDLDTLTTKLTSIDISSDEQSSDDLELIEKFKAPKPKIQQHLHFPKSKRSELANSLCSSIVGTSPALPRTRPDSKRSSRRRFC